MLCLKIYNIINPHNGLYNYLIIRNYIYKVVSLVYPPAVKSWFIAVLFDGEPVIRPEELEDVDTEESSVLEHKEYAESIQASRDNIKIRKKSTVHGVEYVLLGNEAQQYIDYAMPMRIMGYDYGTYKKQTVLYLWLPW